MAYAARGPCTMVSPIETTETARLPLSLGIDVTVHLFAYLINPSLKKLQYYG